MNCFAGQVITEVRKREILWNKSHVYYSARSYVDTAWTEVATVLERDKEEIKSKWRNLRDQFQRELRKAKVLPSGELGPYPGKWCYFEHLYFLKDVMLPTLLKRSERISEIDVNDEDGDEWQIHIKEDCSSPTFEQANVDEEEFDEFETKSPEAVQIPEISLLNHRSKRQKRKANLDLEIQDKKVRKEHDADVDDDMCFVKSLVPFLRKLKPIRKLVVRNEIQSLLIRELLCEKCSKGPQNPNCSCVS